MNFGADSADRASRRILAAMIFCGAMLTMLSFAMQMGPDTFKSRLQGLVTNAGALVSSSGAPTR